VKNYHPTKEEMMLWSCFPDATWNFHLRTGLKAVDGHAHWFKLDVAFPSLKLDVEVDGGVHLIPEKMKRDKARTAILQSLGWTVLRFWNREVTQDLARVKGVIESTILRLTGTRVTP
jgi:very-short-patch-repair endonuclease